jgi:hypothetical protein
MIANRDGDLRDVITDDMVVGDDQPVLRNDDARPQALLGAAAAEHFALLAEEVLKKWIVREGRRRAPDDLHRRDVGDGANGLRGDAGEIRAAVIGGRGGDLRRGLGRGGGGRLERDDLGPIGGAPR